MDRPVSNTLRELPSVDRLLNMPAAGQMIGEFGRQAATGAIRACLAQLRENLRVGAHLPSPEDVIIAARASLAAAERSTLAPVFNLTGTVLHTNFGRAVLAEAAITAATAAMREAVTLEFDLETARRGERDDHVRALLCELTGAEDATLVNNNAAAVLLVLNTLAQNRDAVVSRGELIEIGGAFRMPDIMARAGARLCEVGTTNRTHESDYAAAVGSDTGVILKVHTSNYRIEGFTAEVPASRLFALARAANVPLVNDLGSGTLIDLSTYGLVKEPTVREAVAQADVVTFSGDKLLGGPQAGFIVGQRELIARINKNPMKRALRVDKIRLAAIEATLKLYRDPDRLHENLPILRYLARPQAEIRAAAERLQPALQAAIGRRFTVMTADCASQIGSGALPLDTIPSAGLAVRSSTGERALETLAAALRRLPRPIIGRIEDGALRFDLRCLDDEAAFAEMLSQLDGSALA